MTLVSLAGHQLSRKQMAWEAVFLHPDDTRPVQRSWALRSIPSMLSVSALSMQDLEFDDLVLPAHAKFGTRGKDMELL